MIVYDFPFTIIVTRLLRGRLELATVYPIRMWLSTELLCFWRNKVIIHSMTFLCAVIVFVCWCLRIRMRDLCNVSFRPTFWASRAIAVKWAKEIHQNTICKLMSPQNGKTFCERTDWQYETWNLVCDNTSRPAGYSSIILLSGDQSHMGDRLTHASRREGFLLYPPYKLITWLDLVTKVSIISTVTSFVSTLCTMNVKCMQKGIQVNVMRIST